MDWIQVFVIIGVFIGGYFHLSSKIDKCATRDDLITVKIDLKDDLSTVQKNFKEDISKLTKKIDDVNTNLSKKIDDVNTNLSKKIDDVNTNLSNKIDKCSKAQDLSNLTGKVMDLNRDIGIVIGQSRLKVVAIQEEKPKKKAKGE